jgi:hypothetical protein
MSIPGSRRVAVGWDVNADRHRALSRAFGAPVELRPTTLASAGLTDGVADVLLGSTIEHFADPKLELAHGDPKELHGFPEFTTERVMAGLAGYLVGQPYPALAQCLIARRATSAMM